MSQPQGVFGLEVPPGGVLIPVGLDLPASIHISMAAIDPTAEPEADAEGKTPTVGRSTLRIVRRPIDFLGDEEEDEDDEYLRSILGGSDDDEEDSDDEPNGGPSDPSKARRKQELRALLAAAAAEESAEDEDEEMEDASAAKKGKAVAKKGKGKAPATEEDSEEDSEEEDDDEEDDEDLILEDFVLCTLDTERQYQQPLEITIEAGEQVFFTVSGTHTIHLTGNYAVEDDSEDEDSDEEDSDDDDYDLPPGIDLEDLDSDEEVDELDELDALTGRIEEVDSEEEAPKLTKKEKAKGKKRAAEEDAEPSLEDLITKEAAKADDKLSKKQAKKLKNNAGDAIAVQEDKDAKDKKRVQFAKTLEQGPTGSAAKETKEAAKKTGVKVVQGVTIDDRKAGSGRVVKNGDRVGMRYIGKLENGKVFDSNKKGAPFSFRVGKGEVIRGWDIGIAGMSIGGERRLTIPASLAYGNRKLDGIPANSTLIFDVKLLEIK